ncbi:hypothetical protein V1525DRAFT_147763 [Lipomyces kononenkoae]|uniref:Uncharacterized protein n=1 Tax=Lipomyces kononenkoae TaxID=34357 RepID=A0ACC3T2S0_LIPKO
MLTPRIQRLALGREYAQPSTPPSINSDHQNESAIEGRKRYRRAKQAQRDVFAKAKERLLLDVAGAEQQDLMELMAWLISCGSLITCAVLLWPVQSIKGMIGTYKMTEDMTYVEFMKLFWRDCPTVMELFAGLPGHLLYRSVELAGDGVRVLALKTLQMFRSEGASGGRLLLAADLVLRGVAWLSSYPILEFYNLQRLRIEPADRILPSRSIFRGAYSYSFLRENSSRLIGTASLMAFGSILAESLYNVLDSLCFSTGGSNDQIVKVVTQDLSRSLLSPILSIVVAPVDFIFYRYLARRTLPDHRNIYQIWEMGNWRLIAEALAVETFAGWSMAGFSFWMFVRSYRRMYSKSSKRTE